MSVRPRNIDRGSEAGAIGSAGRHMPIAREEHPKRTGHPHWAAGQSGGNAQKGLARHAMPDIGRAGSARKGSAPTTKGTDSGRGYRPDQSGEMGICGDEAERAAEQDEADAAGRATGSIARDLGAAERPGADRGPPGEQQRQGREEGRG